MKKIFHYLMACGLILSCSAAAVKKKSKVQKGAKKSESFTMCESLCWGVVKNELPCDELPGNYCQRIYQECKDVCEKKGIECPKSAIKCPKSVIKGVNKEDIAKCQRDETPEKERPEWYRKAFKLMEEKIKAC